MGRKQKKYEAKWRKWAADQIKRGVPRQKLSDHLLTIITTNDLKKPLDEIVAISAVEKEIFGVMVERNQSGSAAEKAERIEEAIALYEANIADLFVGTHPYNRLRIIYSKHKDYDNAIRVCKAALGVLNDKKGKKYQGFVEQIEKLEQKRAAQSGQ